MTYINITSKGQVTIPKKFRDDLGLVPGSRVSFSKKNGKLQIDPIPDFRSLRGIVKTDKKYNKKEIQEAIGGHIAEEWGKKLKRCS